MFLKTFTLLVTLLSFSSLASNQYVITGNTRTKEDYIQYLIKECVKKGKSDIEQCLLNKKIFSKVEVEGNEVKITERWTLIPIPQVNIGSASSSYGVFIIERNFLGRGKFAVLGASVGSDVNSFFLMYRDPELLLTDWTAEFLAHNSQEDLKSYSGEDITYSYNESQKGLRLGVGHKLFSDFEFLFSGTLSQKKYKDFGGFTTPIDNDSYGVDINLKYVNSDFKFYFNEGFDGDFSYIRDLKRTDGLDEISAGLLNFRFQKNIFMQHALQFGLKSVVSNNATIKDVMKMGGSKGFRGIQENGLWAENVVSLSTDYQIPLIFSNYGVWTIAPFFDYGLIESDYSSISNFSSYGIGGYLYLKQVAIPGIGIIVGRNERFQGRFISFSIGLKP